MTNHTEKAIEAAAEAEYRADHPDADETVWPGAPEWIKASYRARVRRAIAAYEAAMWRPIEEAPKEWLPILVFDPALAEDERLQVAAWNDIGNYWQSWIDDAPDPDPAVFRPLPSLPEGVE